VISRRREFKKMNKAGRIKKIPIKDVDSFIDIVANAYPGFKIVSPEEKRKTRRRFRKLLRDQTICHYGLYRDGKLLGGMRTYDFTMNLFSLRILVGGVGLVAVDLLHKKEKVCKDLISAFIALHKKKTPLVALYPFRPDFYRKMGFGYGTKLNEYRIRPSDLPRGNSKQHVRFLLKRDRKAFKECCHRYFLMHHGMFDIKEHELDYFFLHPEAKTVVYKKNKRVSGYLCFVFKKAKDENFLRNNIEIKELIYENRDVLMELLTFMYTQLDQIDRIIWPTQDENVHFLPLDPRDGSENLIPILAHQTNTQGVGIMYRVIDVRGMFKLLKNHIFGHQNCRLRLNVKDSFLKENEGSVIVHFKDGRSSVKNRGDFDVEVYIDISDFSSLILGAVNYKSLFEYGLSDISSERYLDVVHNIFAVDKKPICHTIF